MTSTTTAWSPLRAYALEAKYELLKVARMPGYTIPSITFPVMFYALFGLSFGGTRAAGSTTFATYLLATYGAFGVIGAAMFAFGVGVAVERGQGWMTLKRATPMPPLAYFTGKLFTCTMFSIAIVGLLSTLGAAFGGVQLTASSWIRLWTTLVLGTIPFGALGLAVGYFAGPNSAPPIVNLIYLPSGFLAGLWIPIEVLPRALQTFARFLPPYHLGQLALQAVGAGRGDSPWVHVVVLVGFTLAGLGLALWGLDREDDGRYG